MSNNRFKTIVRKPIELWQWWVTPQITDTEIAFRERTLRTITPIVLLFNVVLLFIPNGQETRWFIPAWLTTSLVLFFLVSTLIAIINQRITLAAIFFFSFLTLTVFSQTATWGYDGRSVLPIVFLFVVFSVVVLPTSLSTIFTLVIISGIAIIGDYQVRVLGYPMPEMAEGFLLTPLINSISLGFTSFIFVAIFRYLKNEFDKRVEEVNTLAATLEQRVTERTRDLKMSADVARQATTQLDLEQLLPQLVEQVRATFQLYFVSAFLYEVDSQQLHFVAGTGEAGRLMLVNGSHFHINARPSLVAKAAREKRSVVINDVSVEEAYAQNIYLPNTRSESVLPMLVGNQLIGVLGFQSEVNDRFTPADMDIFSTLAEQTAIAVNNAQLYARQAELAEELRIADQSKSQFLASMSHELRTPLNAIMNFTEMVTMGIMGDVNNEQKDLLDQSLDSSKHLLNLINDVLDISKVQAGKLNLFVENDVDLYAEIKAVVGMIEPMLKNKPVQFVQNIDDDLPLLTGDKRRIRQIMLNLVSNAAKFTDEGSITLSLKNGGDHVQLAVIDCGPGITPDLQEIIFEPFMQTPDGVKHAEGTGLGLPITKSLVEAHGGRIWLESEPGNGAAFYVTLPLQVKHNGKE
jgi:signal transduction histidine kinase